jgi:23S rRNA (adenine2503-C2)-methyltransferase
MKDIKNFTLLELKDEFKSRGYPGYAAQQVFIWVCSKGVQDFDLMTDIAVKVRTELKEKFYCSSLSLDAQQVSEDDTKKFLFGLEDGNKIETVLIPRRDKLTLCVSSQVGCKYACKFCSSGQAGFIRDLKVSEIVNQYTQVKDMIAPQKITNIVFMGIGEPLDNFDNVIAAINILNEPKGCGLGSGRITISTCGLADKIRKLADLKRGTRLSISLHASTDELRSQIMPVNKKYPLDELIDAVRYFNRKADHFVTFEYVLIKDVNCDKEEALRLAQLLKGVYCKMNLIACNQPGGELLAPSAAQINDFQMELKRHGIFATLRKSRGQDIAAACGQLRAQHKNKST